MTERPPLTALVLYFLRLGLTGFGGPVASANYVRRNLSDFRRDILPKLQRFRVCVIADEMRASLSHGSKVRNGRLLPHRRHWKALRRLLSSTPR